MLQHILLSILGCSRNSVGFFSFIMNSKKLSLFQDEYSFFTLGKFNKNANFFFNLSSRPHGSNIVPFTDSILIQNSHRSPCCQVTSLSQVQKNEEKGRKISRRRRRGKKRRTRRRKRRRTSRIRGNRRRTRKLRAGGGERMLVWYFYLFGKGKASLCHSWCRRVNRENFLWGLWEVGNVPHYRSHARFHLGSKWTTPKTGRAQGSSSQKERLFEL